MARNDEQRILSLEKEGALLGSIVVDQSLQAGERELAEQFHWIADQLVQTLREETPAKRRRLRQETSKRTKELGDVVRAKHIQHHLPFSCIDDYDECVRGRKKQKKSPYLCSVALFICLARSMTALLAAIAAAAKAGGLLG